MHGRIDHHGRFVWVLIHDFLIHLEEVAVTRFDDGFAQPVDRIGKVEVYGQTGAAHAVACIAAFLGGPRGHIAWHQVAEGRIPSFKVIVAVFLPDVVGFQLSFPDLFGIFLALWHPDAPVVAEAFAHQGEFRLVVAVNRYTGGVDLCEAGVAEQRTTLIGLPGSAAVRGHGHGGKEEYVAVATGGQHHGMTEVAFKLAVDEVACDDAARPAIDHHQVHHLPAGVHLYRPLTDLLAEGTVGAEQQLLARLPACIKGAGYQCPAERAVVEKAAVIACKRNAARHTLVDDVVADLGQTVNIGFTGTVVASLYGIIEQPVDAVAIVGIVLGGIDPSLRGNAVSTARTVLDTEILHVEAQLA